MNAIYQMKTWQKYCSKFHTEIPKWYGATGPTGTL